MAEKRKGTPCPTCRRTVRPGVQCRAFSCPFLRKAGHTGVQVLDRPLKQHWQ